MLKKAVVQVPAFQEADLDVVLDGIAGQTMPAAWEVDLEAWVTPDPRYDTLAQARAHQQFEAFEAPPGKLSARNAAHDHAQEEGAEAIVTWDADSPPAHGSVLAAMLGPFGQDEDVVGVNGNPKMERSPLGYAVRGLSALEDRLMPHMNGQLSAFSSYAWDAAGPFDEDLDQREINEVRDEEEFAFRSRLEDVGDVVDATEAVVLEDDRRVRHHLWRAMDRFGHYPGDEWVTARGEASFWFPPE